MFIIVTMKIPLFKIVFLAHFSDFWALGIHPKWFSSIYVQKNLFFQLLLYIFSLLKFFCTKYQGLKNRHFWIKGIEYVYYVVIHIWSIDEIFRRIWQTGTSAKKIDKVIQSKTTVSALGIWWGGGGEGGKRTARWALDFPLYIFYGGINAKRTKISIKNAYIMSLLSWRRDEG